MLAASRQVAYIHEPLNVERPPGLLPCQTPYRYTYISRHNGHLYDPAFGRLVRLRYSRPRLAELRGSPTEAARVARHWGRMTTGALLGRRPLIKDPFAVFSSPWFAERLGCSVVVTIRHPAAVVASRLRMGWRFPVNEFLEQRELMTDWLEPLRGELEEASRSDDPLLQGAVLWKAIYHVVSQYAERSPSCTIVRHEDLARSPEGAYRELYATLGLEFTPHASKTVIASTRPRRWVLRASPYSVVRDSRRSASLWKDELSNREIERIWSLTHTVAMQWYDADGKA